MSISNDNSLNLIGPSDDLDSGHYTTPPPCTLIQTPYAMSLNGVIFIYQIDYVILNPHKKQLLYRL